MCKNHLDDFAPETAQAPASERGATSRIARPVTDRILRALARDDERPAASADDADEPAFATR